MPQIVIVGCGPGGAAYVTPEAAAAVQGAAVLVGAQRLLNLFPDSQAQRIPVRGEVQAAIDAVERYREAGVALLVTGDPGVASLARGVIAHFGPEACRVIAGISSIQVAFARLGVEWTDARMINAHSREPELSFGSLAGEDKIAILAGSQVAVNWAADLARSLGTAWRFFAASDLTLDGERVREITPEDLRKEPLPTRTVLVFLRRDLR